jgi:hypothetical protein
MEEMVGYPLVMRQQRFGLHGILCIGDGIGLKTIIRNLQMIRMRRQS